VTEREPPTDAIDRLRAALDELPPDAAPVARGRLIAYLTDAVASSPGMEEEIIDLLGVRAPRGSRSWSSSSCSGWVLAAVEVFHDRLLAIVDNLPGAVEDRPWGSVHCKVAGKNLRRIGPQGGRAKAARQGM
jgi:hypothetical protein